MRDSVRVFAPATVANVGSAFDILGFALVEPGDTVVARRRSEPGVAVTKIVSPYGDIPVDPERNTASVAAREVLSRLDPEQGIELEVHKNMPLGSGLGSSAASAAAGAVAASLMLGVELPDDVLVQCAMEGERVACGTAHADNVAPSILGGIVLIRSYNPLDIVRISVPSGLYYGVVTPGIEVRTEDARKVLRREVRLSDAVVQMGNVAGLVAGLMQSDLKLVGRSLQDVLIEPHRAALIPGFDKVKTAAMEAGALGCGISGSGPSVFAFCEDEESASRCASAMAGSFRTSGIECLMFHGPVGSQGARVME